MVATNITKTAPVVVYIIVGERLPSESSKRVAIEVRLRLQRKNASRQLFRKPSYTHLAKYSHVSRAMLNTVMTKRFIGLVGLLL